MAKASNTQDCSMSMGKSFELSFRFFSFTYRDHCLLLYNSTNNWTLFILKIASVSLCVCLNMESGRATDQMNKITSTFTHYYNFLLFLFKAQLKKSTTSFNCFINEASTIGQGPRQLTVIN